MKRFVYLTTALTCLLAMFVGCAAQSVSAANEPNSVTQKTTVQGNDATAAEEATDMISVPKEKAELLTKYEALLNLLETENYQGAESYIHNLVLQQKKESAGEMEDYLVTVDLNSDNFEDYFELVVLPEYNSFGEATGDFYYGFRSKMYDEGLIIYDMDEIALEVEYTDSYAPEDPYKMEGSLNELLTFNHGISKDTTVKYAGRITDGTITFIKQEYVDEYVIPELESPSDRGALGTVKLLNGETISRFVVPDYPY